MTDLYTKVLNWVAETDRTALIGLVVANLLPLVLCLLFGWDIGSLVLFYWCENIVIGMFAILRILMAKSDMHQPGSKNDTGNIRLPGAFANCFLAGFFTIHFFAFCFVHGSFLMIALSMGFENGRLDIDYSPFDENLLGSVYKTIPSGGLFSIVALIVSHGISFYRNYVCRGEYLKTTAHEEMFRPYKRIVLLHVCIIAGVFLVLILGSHKFMVILFVLAKTGLDAVVHSRSHQDNSHAS